MLSLKQRREKDAEITRNFLAANRIKAQKIAGLCAQGLQEIADKLKCEYYLKGSNSIALLKGEAPTGDWDFQFKPGAQIYANWRLEFGRVDEAIKELLLRVAGGEEGRDGWVDNPEWFRTADGIGEKEVASFTAGEKAFRFSNYQEVAAKCNNAEHRVVLDRKGIFIMSGNDNAKGPIVYVNYTIPGFILYRMAYLHRYGKEGEERYALKSELIDISIPRPGSGEVYLAQDGVVTYFRNKEMAVDAACYQFRIPGWGYHFYENLNLLQEITLGVSGSPDKRQKRLDRGNDAMSALLAASRNPDGNFIELEGVFEDPAPQIGGQISSFWEIMTYNVADCPELRNNLVGYLKGRYGTFKVKKGGVRTFEQLSGFDFVKSEPQKVKEVSALLNSILKGIEITGGRVSDPNTIKILKGDYRVASPLEDLTPEAAFPLLYVLVDVNEKAFKLLKDGLAGGKVKGVKNISLKNDILIVRSIEKTSMGESEWEAPQSIRFCFRKAKFPENYSIERFLEKTIFESQRCELVKAFQKS